MKKKYYTRPTMRVVKINLQRFLMQSGVSASRRDYGTASAKDGTEQTWE